MYHLFLQVKVNFYLLFFFFGPIREGIYSRKHPSLNNNIIRNNVNEGNEGNGGNEENRGQFTVQK